MRKTELGSAFGVMHSVSASASASPRATCVVHLEGYGMEAERATRMLGHHVSIVNQHQMRKLIEERDTLRAALEEIAASENASRSIAAAALADDDAETYP